MGKCPINLNQEAPCDQGLTPFLHTCSIPAHWNEHCNPQQTCSIVSSLLKHRTVSAVLFFIGGKGFLISSTVSMDLSHHL